MQSFCRLFVPCKPNWCCQSNSIIVALHLIDVLTGPLPIALNRFEFKLWSLILSTSKDRTRKSKEGVDLGLSKYRYIAEKSLISNTEISNLEIDIFKMSLDKFILENCYLKFNPEWDNLKNRHYKPGKNVGNL